MHMSAGEASRPPVFGGRFRGRFFFENFSFSTKAKFRLHTL
jgi:hypothetical protein